MPLTVGIERWPLAKPFAIARGTKTEALTVVVRVSDGDAVGLGECTPYARYGETPEGVMAAIAAERDALDDLSDPATQRRRLMASLEPGAARNALDCALWDLEAKRTGRRVAEMAGLTPPATTITAQTLGIDAPAAMAQAAAALASTPGPLLIKAKLGAGDTAEEAERLKRIRAAAPEAAIIVDANEGWDAERLVALDPVCHEIDARFIEQPLPADQDEALGELSLKTPICADESCHTADDLDRLVGKYQVVNVKLDKTGGLTAAIELRAAALARGLDLMIGCMVAGSLAMAPAFLLVEGAAAVDLDGPLLLARDREAAIRFDGATMHAPDPALWG